MPALNSSVDPRYRRVGTNRRPPRSTETRKYPPLGIRCKSCGETIPLKSNAGIAETMEILSWHPDRHCCPNEACEYHLVDMRAQPRFYYRHGKSAEGRPRWRCRAYGATFVVRARHRAPRATEYPYRTEQITRALLNSMPVNRVMEVFGVGAQTVYDVIERAYTASLIFSAARDSALAPADDKHRTRYLSTDRQAYSTNWRQRHDKRNTILRAVMSTDIESGYVFPVHLNYDPRAVVLDINRIAATLGDSEQPGIWRRFPHYWLLNDYGEGLYRVKKDALPQSEVN